MPIFGHYECDKNLHVNGKVILITGTNVGIGYETVLELLKRGAAVIHITCRSEEKCQQTKASLLKSVEIDSSSIVTHVLELSSIQKVLRFVQEFKQTVPYIDILINNSGMGATTYNLTEDGFEQTMQINYISPFIMTNELMSLLKASKSIPRVINVASSAYEKGSIKDLQLTGRENDYDFFQVYSNTKFANVLHAQSLASQGEIVAVSLHPGVVDTSIWRNLKGMHKFIIGILSRFLFKSSYQGAQTTIYCATAPDDELKAHNGGYFIDNRAVKLKNKELEDHELAQKLWNHTDELVREKVKEIKENL